MSPQAINAPMFGMTIELRKFPNFWTFTFTLERSCAILFILLLLGLCPRLYLLIQIIRLSCKRIQFNEKPSLSPLSGQGCRCLELCRAQGRARIKTPPFRHFRLPNCAVHRDGTNLPPQIVSRTGTPKHQNPATPRIPPPELCGAQGHNHPCRPSPDKSVFSVFSSHKATAMHFAR